MQITEGERLALLVAIDKRLSPALKEAKDAARDDLMASYTEDGTDRKAVKVGDEKVGEVGISYSKPAPFIYGGCEKEALDFLHPLGLTEEVPKKGWEKEFELIGGDVVHKATGEVVAWAGWQPKAPKTASVRGCKPEDVMRAFGPRLGGMDAAALLDGEVE